MSQYISCEPYLPNVVEQHSNSNNLANAAGQIGVFKEYIQLQRSIMARLQALEGNFQGTQHIKLL